MSHDPRRPSSADTPSRAWHDTSEARLVGVSGVIRHLEEQIAAAARSDAKVLITGESGVGKEVAARLIHRQSRRTAKALVTVNCAGIPETLLESELFGHVRGSFTDAHRDKTGLLESAKDGTIFLDEVGEMSLRMQALLLRFLETGEIQRVGADGLSERLDVRVVCATNRSLTDRIAEGQFRADLYYRLNVIQLHIAPLRERQEDVPLLLEYFVGRLARTHQLPAPSLSGDLLARLCQYDWPGNVRQLKNVVERLVVRSASGPLSVADLPSEFAAARQVASATFGVQPTASEAVDLAHQLFDKVVLGGGSFWAIVYEPFAVHDLTRATLRTVVELGLTATHGRYSELVSLFNMERRDYKRFLNTLKKHDCLVPFHPFRAAARHDLTDHARVA
ncbi:MAG: sigma-54 dependent transcriptional regulator [Vicinamibacterales bacterium]